MKKMIFLMLVFFLGITASMNAQVNIGSADGPTAGAVLDLSQSGAKLGLILPNVPLSGTTPFQLGGNDTKDLTSYPAAAGTIVYNDGTGALTAAGVYVWNGSAWTLASAPVTPPEPSCPTPGTPVKITISPTTVTAGGTFTATIAAVADATAYVWSTPAGLSKQVSGDGLTATYTTSTPGTISKNDITVAAQNACGNTGAAKKSDDDVIVNPAPPAGVQVTGGVFDYYTQPETSFEAYAVEDWYPNGNLVIALTNLPNSQYTWFAAVDVCASAGWRLPNLRELRWMYENKTIINDALTAAGGTNLTNGNTWSGSEKDDSKSWYVQMLTGSYNATSNTTTTYYVRCVRSN
jgi:hypothetical protein